ncbi:hypothetical protein BIS09_01350 [Halomonas sp. R1t8]|jgi:hypothetical protein|uniref:hypothetical protein n=1 Tax=unclassified Halomonas TaxID=2609666 RepID=UPI000ADF2B33|nr:MULTISPECIES: hypothetical protein [unclassified Halomonas]MCP1302514.1 hypothetical protein [Halomonas sp. R1t8]MCP1328988.1 hypothetical protein [Halomonas sp. R1t4]MED5295888.1 hypothetical protein [Pseudomonadota bacterium]|tara:strand:- start:162 stop:314 length:153 start_codon:yes stop_codon:yes gene_type:complete
MSDWGARQRTHTDAFKGEPGRRSHWQLQHRLGIEGDDDAHEVSLGVSWYF